MKFHWRRWHRQPSLARAYRRAQAWPLTGDGKHAKQAIAEINAREDLSENQIAPMLAEARYRDWRLSRFRVVASRANFD